MRLALAALLVLAARTARADDVCARPYVEANEQPGVFLFVPHSCTRIARLHLASGEAELYRGYDTRDDASATREQIARHIARGEYRAVYVLVLPGHPGQLAGPFEQGGQPNAHHYEICGSESDWCTQIAASEATLAADGKGLEVVMKTTTRQQSVTYDPDGKRHSPSVRRHVIKDTVRCVPSADGWTCSGPP